MISKLHTLVTAAANISDEMKFKITQTEELFFEDSVGKNRNDKFGNKTANTKETVLSSFGSLSIVSTG